MRHTWSLLVIAGSIRYHQRPRQGSSRLKILHHSQQVRREPRRREAQRCESLSWKEKGRRVRRGDGEKDGDFEMKGVILIKEMRGWIDRVRHTMYVLNLAPPPDKTTHSFWAVHSSVADRKQVDYRKRKRKKRRKCDVSFNPCVCGCGSNHIDITAKQKYLCKCIKSLSLSSIPLSTQRLLRLS